MVTACARRPGRSPPRRSRSARSRSRSRRSARAACPSSTGCSAAGWCPGAAILLAGEPGVGKSTLLLEVAAQTARTSRRTLYITGEESASQVRLRADRTGGVHDELYLAAETDLGAVLSHIEQVRPELIVVDSVQTIGAAETDGAPGGVTQVKEVAAALIRVAKTRNITTVLIGHVTKDGSIAGPRVLEHVVDVVLHFEGDRNSRFRMLRAMKNRFGPVDEVGCFDLSSEGIRAVTDPTGLFVENHVQQVPGTCVAVSMEGRRPLLAEVQALVTASPIDKPRRTVSGLDSSRVAMVIAVLQQHCRLRLHNQDVFASTVGGARLSEPATDLAIAISLASASVLPPGPAGHRRDRRDRPGRRAAPGPRPAAAAGRGGPARASSTPWSRPSAPAPPAASARSTGCGSSTCPTSAPRWPGSASTPRSGWRRTSAPADPTASPTDPLD